MAVKNAVAKNWVITPSFDGYLYSAYPNGDKPSGYQTAPTLLFTDVVAGPTTGGEGNNGCYLTLWGYSFGRSDQLGTASGARVYIGGVEVANYRYLRTAITYDWNQLVEICVQVGSLGAQTGALDVKVTVNSVDSNTITGGFYVQPGRIAFISQSGSDATGLFNTIASPFRYLQDYAGGTGSPVAGSLWAATTAQGETGARAGDFLVLRAGTWVDMVGYDANWFRHKDKDFTAPNGVAGNGYITVQRYPGPILGNAPEVVTFASPAGTVNKGGIQGPSGPNALAGHGKYMVISGINFTGVATSGVGGLVNLQSGADYWRVIGCEMGPWPSTADARVGGVAGNGTGVKVLGCYIHDIAADPTPGNLNHGVYLDGSNSGGWDKCSANCEVGYSVIRNITNGSGIQTFNQDSSDVITGIEIHHNWVENTAKYGINNGASTKSCNSWNNVVFNIPFAGYRFDAAVASSVFKVNHNLFWNCNTAGSGPAQGSMNNDGNIAGTSVLNVQHNMFVLKAGRGAGRASNDFYTSNGTGDSVLALSQNLYYDADGTKSAPAKDTTAVTGNPNWTDSANGDFTQLTGGAGLGACTAAETLAIANDYYGVARPVTGTGAPGATKNDIGPMQGIGT